MKRVTGIGGVFFKADDPGKLQDWYVKHLDLPVDRDGYVSFAWREKGDRKRVGMTVWSLFPRDSKYFDPSEKPFMINFRVNDLHKVLAALREEGVTVDDKVEESEFGKFGWIMDPEGNRIELWEPPE